MNTTYGVPTSVSTSNDPGSATNHPLDAVHLTYQLLYPSKGLVDRCPAGLVVSSLGGSAPTERHGYGNH